MLDVLYLLTGVLALPWLLWRRIRGGKRVTGFRAKVTGNVTDRKPGTKPRIWLHAVSVGEVILLEPIIKQLRLHYPQWECWLSVTTSTGRDVAEKTYPHLNIIWFPFDFSWAVRRALHLVRPKLIILAELELWPNFIRVASTLEIPVVVVNGRVSERSARGYGRIRWLVASLLRRISCFAVQQEEYAARLRQLGMPSERIVVTGSVKFDGVTVNRQDASVERVRSLVLGPESTVLSEQGNLVWVVGSTQAPEEAWALEIFREARLRYPQLR